MPRSSIALWILAPLLLALTMYRPFRPSEGRAEALPTTLEGYRLHRDKRLTPRQLELLGTSDVVWQTYVNERGKYVYFVAVFHEENWKSVHPPRICLEGSDMTITAEGSLPLRPGRPGVDAGRILAHSRSNDSDYLSLYIYGAEDMRASQYLDFFLYHAPRALVRRATSGFLLRVETFVDDEGVEVAERRCRDFLVKMMPEAMKVLEASSDG